MKATAVFCTLIASLSACPALAQSSSGPIPETILVTDEDTQQVAIIPVAEVTVTPADVPPQGNASPQKDAPTAGEQVPGDEAAMDGMFGSDRRLQTTWTGRTEVATRLRDPDKITKARQYVYLRGKYAAGEFDDGKGRANFQFTVRGYYDAVFDLTNRYPRNVEKDEQDELSLREAVLSLNRGKVAMRIGRQQVVWGESVGLFFADVVNPKDLREFLLRDLDDIRIPLWGVDTVVSTGENRALELFWTPEVRFSKLPQPGSEFDFYTQAVPPGVVVNINSQSKPSSGFDNSTYGVRYSQLIKGTDAAFFYLRAFDDLPAVSKTLTLPGGVPTVDVTLSHPRVNRYGATLSKPLGKSILKSEVVYTTGRQFETQAIGSAVERNYLTAMVGINHPLSRYNFDVQLFRSSIGGSGGALRERSGRTGVSLRLADDASLRKLKPEILFVGSLNQNDVWFSPKVHYRLSEATTLTLGVDYFNGRRDTLFGQFHRASRAQAQLTWGMF